MRITAGKFKGHSIISPKGDDIRPTSDRVREALFSILGDIESCTVLDLCAGSGALGFEALSRGADFASFFDMSERSIFAIKNSAQKLNILDKVSIKKTLLPFGLSLLEKDIRSYDLVFLDPPYVTSIIDPLLNIFGECTILPNLKILKNKLGNPILSNGSRLIVEHDRDVELLADYNLLSKYDERRYGRTILSFYEYNESLDSL